MEGKKVNWYQKTCGQRCGPHWKQGLEVLILYQVWTSIQCSPQFPLITNRCINSRRVPCWHTISYWDCSVFLSGFKKTQSLIYPTSSEHPVLDHYLMCATQCVCVLTLCDPLTVAHRTPLFWGILQARKRVVCHFLPQGIFLTQGSNLHLLHWQVGSLPLPPTGKHLYSSMNYKGTWDFFFNRLWDHPNGSPSTHSAPCLRHLFASRGFLCQETSLGVLSEFRHTGH